MVSAWPLCGPPATATLEGPELPRVDLGPAHRLPANLQISGLSGLVGAAPQIGAVTLTCMQAPTSSWPQTKLPLGLGIL